MAARTASFGIRTITSTAREGLANSGVHIRVYPRPRNLAESREILRVLEEYGEVVMYKHLKVCFPMRLFVAYMFVRRD